ncbi:MAG: diguanylate cyclase [Oscillospiraceae bacterium]
MLIPLILQCITVAAGIGVTGYTIAKQRTAKMLYFTCFIICVTIFSLGYLLQITASSLDAALVAYRLEYLGVPFIGPFFYLFCRDYANCTYRNRGYVLALMAFPMLVVLLVATWPASTLFIEDFQFSSWGSLFHLQAVPGVLYYVGMAYFYGFALAGAVLIFRYLVRTNLPNAKYYFTILLLLVLLVVLGQVLTWLGIFPLSFNAVPMAVTLGAILLEWHLVRFRTQEWTGLGRESVVEKMKDAFVLLDTKGRFLDANAVAYAYFSGLENLSAGATIDRIADFPEALVAGREDVTEFTIGEGEDTIYLRASRSPLEYDGRVLGSCIMFYDISETRVLMNNLQALATKDALTGLLNRGTFFNYAQRDFDLAIRNRENASVLMIDIDFFKMVNDVHGHLYGDKVLVEIASILLNRLRNTDIVGRYGGEEIAVWLPGASSEGAAIIADVIRRAVEHTTFESDNGRFNVTISVGVCALDAARHSNLEAMISDADTALYRAKAEGRNRVCVAKPVLASEG